MADKKNVRDIIAAEYKRIALRDQFAMAALQGLCSKPNQSGSIQRIVRHVELTAGEAYDYADAMMAERAPRTAPAAVAKPVPVAPGVMEALEDVLGYLDRVRQIPEVRQALECVYWPADHPVFKAHTVLADAKAKPAAPVADSDGWIEWGGGSCPVPEEVFVDIRIKDGGELSGPAGDFMWEHPLAGWNEIVFYRVVKP